VLPVVPQKILDVDLAAVGLIGRLAGKCAVQAELALQLLGVLGPFLLIEEIFRRFATSVEE
jgi:hypothetical protein